MLVVRIPAAWRAANPSSTSFANSLEIVIGTGIEDLRDLLDVPGAHLTEHRDVDAVLWSKLLFNLNNALNALSDLPRYRAWRQALAL
jgi:hypothetical protein